MKKGILYLLIIAYSTIMLKPVLPFVSDMVAHIFWYSQHVATVHYENGKFHVHKEYMEAAKDNAPEKNTNAARTESSPNEHLVVADSYNFSITPLIQTHFPALQVSILTNAITGDYPPPKA